MARKMTEVEYTFKNAMSVQDLAHIVSTIDMEEMIEGSKLEFIQKTNGCVSMTIPRQDGDKPCQCKNTACYSRQLGVNGPLSRIVHQVVC